MAHITPVHRTEPNHPLRTECVAHDGCVRTPIPDCPVPLCAKHLGRVYRFAQDAIDATTKPKGPRSRKTPEENLAIGARPRAMTSGYVYFARFDSRIKIGFSRRVRGRMNDLNTDELLVAVPGTPEDERRYHAMFADLRLQGEWFKGAPRLLSFIEDLRAKPTRAA